MSEIADFLRARITERRALADSIHSRDCESVPDILYPDRETGACDCGEPATVIADCDAKLALINEIEPALDENLEPATDAELHALESHSAYEYRTTSGPRKQWDDVDMPPCDDNGDPEPGWERNTDAGRDGWERFDYTEESYWRRLRPDGPRSVHLPRTLRILAQPYAGHPDHSGDEWAL
jgi:hypothetical protein